MHKLQRQYIRKEWPTKLAHTFLRKNALLYDWSTRLVSVSTLSLFLLLRLPKRVALWRRALGSLGLMGLGPQDYFR